MVIKLNIAILLSNNFDPTAGGVQKSTAKLADIFKGLGHRVLIISLEKGQEFFLGNIPVVHLGIDITTRKSKELSQLLNKHEIEIVINQIGFSTSITRMIRRSAGSHVKLINTLRINPLNFIQNSNTFIQNYLDRRNLGYLNNKALLILLRMYHRVKQYINHQYILNHADAYVLLNENFIKELSYFWIDTKKYEKKLFAIPNPFGMPESQVAHQEKENIILYVGRLVKTQKRVDLLMKIWGRLHNRLPDWQFWVLGNGPEKEMMENYCRANKMFNVHFFGFDDPELYYRKAKILHFTSAYEGFGNVLVEAQSYGVIPILFKSYSAAKDIVKDRINGFLIPPFEIDKFERKTVLLANDRELQSAMSEESKLNVSRFSYSAIGDKWVNLFNQII